MADQIDDQHGNQGAQETEQDDQQERCISLKMAESVNDRGRQCDIQKNECQNPVTGRSLKTSFLRPYPRKMIRMKENALRRTALMKYLPGFWNFRILRIFRYFRIQRSSSAITGVWSEGCFHFRGWRSIVQAEHREASFPESKM